MLTSTPQLAPLKSSYPVDRSQVSVYASRNIQDLPLPTSKGLSFYSFSQNMHLTIQLNTVQFLNCGRGLSSQGFCALIFLFGHILLTFLQDLSLNSSSSISLLTFSLARSCVFNMQFPNTSHCPFYHLSHLHCYCIFLNHLQTVLDSMRTGHLHCLAHSRHL